MFRLVADITELNIDQVKLPKIPGLGMLMKLPNKQKISMIVSVLNAQKGQFLPKWQEAEVGAVATFGLSGGTAGGRKLSGAHPDRCGKCGLR
jgi:non-ribosomal peptide synthetase component E (peptide arylation enzyme)